MESKTSDIKFLANTYKLISEILASELPLDKKIIWLEAFEWADSPLGNIDKKIYREAINHLNNIEEK